ncbi:MAG TPA: hypothetical protein VHT97_10985 [Acidimicrobiales bacterium]|jgi:hypothetical protein|nr:hypothetical protein [Acidimicrobiales bacterium]
MRHRGRTALAGLFALLAALGGVTAPPVRAQAPETVGIRLLDAPTDRADDPRARIYIVDHLAPGTVITRRLEVSNSTTKSQAVELYAAAATVADGAFQFGEGRAANDLTTWTKVDPPSVTIAPGATSVVTVTISVPPKAAAGEQYGVVWAELRAAAPAGGGIAAVNRVGVRMYLSVGAGGEPPSNFEVTAVEGQRAADGSPVVAATVHNTGGRALDLSGELRLTNGPGGLSAGPFNATLGTTLGLGQTEPILIPLDKALPNGPWDAKITVRSGTTARDAGGVITFPVATDAASKPAATSSGGSSTDRAVTVVAVALAALVVLVALLVLTRRRRRSRNDEADAQPVDVEPARSGSGGSASA